MQCQVSVRYWLIGLAGLLACEPHEPPIFEQLSTTRTGIDFSNTIQENEQDNVFEYINIYTGAGVAAGDINNDGLIDLYFSGNQVSGRLYLNKGDLQFKDISASAGILNNRWGHRSYYGGYQPGWLARYLRLRIGQRL